MQAETDYLKVGNGEKSGDAIGLRFGDLNSGDPEKQYIVVIDGGFEESGKDMVELIGKYYGKDAYIDLMISTHPDADHISGLREIIKNVNVKYLMMHKPWDHNPDGSVPTESNSREARKSYSLASELEGLAEERGTKIIEPFTGKQIKLLGESYMQIIGPSEDYYLQLLAEFDHNKSVADRIKEAVEAGLKRVVASVNNIFEDENDPQSSTLDDVEKNSDPVNNSSVIVYFNISGEGLLFTGDASVEALHKAADYAESCGIDLSNLNLFDVPHHGSKHNLDLAFVNRVFAKRAVVSAACNSEKHPSPRVKNALIHRGANVFTNEDSNVRFPINNPPSRPEYSTELSPEQFTTEFGDDE